MEGDSLWEKAQHAFIESRTAMGVAGFIAGTMQGAAPGGGFLPPLPLASSGSHTDMFRHWQGAGLAVGGTVAIMAGEGGEIIGIVATTATGGASVALTAGSAVVVASGATAIGRGLILYNENVCSGFGKGPPGSESPPAAQPTKVAPPPPAEPTAPSAQKKVDTAPARASEAPSTGASVGPRAGKAFTPAGKAEVKSESAAANGGQTTCTTCAKPTVPSQQGQGAIVTTAVSAEEGISVFRDLRPAVLISDIGMPAASGYDLIREIRRLSAADGGETPAVALTAYARPEDRIEALRVGFDQHVVKPVSPEQLVAAVSSVCRKRR